MLVYGVDPHGSILAQPDSLNGAISSYKVPAIAMKLHLASSRVLQFYTRTLIDRLKVLVMISSPLCSIVLVSFIYYQLILLLVLALVLRDCVVLNK